MIFIFNYAFSLFFIQDFFERSLLMKLAEYGETAL